MTAFEGMTFKQITCVVTWLVLNINSVVSICAIIVISCIISCHNYINLFLEMGVLPEIAKAVDEMDWT